MKISALCLIECRSRAECEKFILGFERQCRLRDSNSDLDMGHAKQDGKEGAYLLNHSKRPLELLLASYGGGGLSVDGGL